MTSLQLTRRLIVAGDKLTRRHGRVAAERDIKQMIIDTMGVHYRSAGHVYVRLEPAIRSARQPIRDSVRRTATGLARRVMPYCYLCGIEMDFEMDGPQALTLDHVWPRAYGGNPDTENLLGACRSCNKAKCSEPSWAMYPIQSYVAGFEVQHLENMPRVMRFAIQARAAKRLAQCEGLSLRDAYLRLGRPGRPVVLDEATAADLFNLEFSVR